VIACRLENQKILLQEFYVRSGEIDVEGTKGKAQEGCDGSGNGNA
jgi:hypothetical protein